MQPIVFHIRSRGVKPHYRLNERGEMEFHTCVSDQQAWREALRKPKKSIIEREYFE